MKYQQLHLQDDKIGDGPYVLNLSNGDRVSIDGNRNFGDDLIVNATGTDHLDASGGFSSIGAQINLADHAHLVTTGTMLFYYGDAITGGHGAQLTNNGTIQTARGNVSVAVDGHGVLAFTPYHSGPGTASISAPVSAQQTVELINNTVNGGETLGLADPQDFHALVKITPNEVGGVFSNIVLQGVKADSFDVGQDRITLKNGGRVVDVLRVANAGAVPVAATYGPDSTTLAFHQLPPG